MQSDSGDIKRLAFVIFSLRRGGAERVVVSLANHLSARGFQVDIILIGASSEETPAYTLSESVFVKSISEGRQPSKKKFHRFRAALHRLLKLRSALSSSDYDCIYSFTRDINLLCLLSTIGRNVNLVVSERNHPIRFFGESKLRHHLVRLLYPLSKALVVQTEEIARHYAGSSNICIIPNPIAITGRASTPILETEPRIVGAGRLIHQKGFERLLQAVAKFRSEGFLNELVIFGEGPERQSLESMAVKLGLNQNVFEGEVSDLMSVLRASDIFVLSSRYEGFPNVLLEAMAIGATPVAFDCVSGPREMIEDGVNGFLVPEGDVTALSDKISYLLRNPEIRQKMSWEAQKVTANYSVEKIADRWLALIKS